MVEESCFGYRVRVYKKQTDTGTDKVPVSAAFSIYTSLLAIAFQLFSLELADEVEMLLYFRLGIVYVHQRRLGKHFGSCCRILNQQVRHYAHGSHFVKTASHEV